MQFRKWIFFAQHHGHVLVGYVRLDAILTDQRGEQGEALQLIARFAVVAPFECACEGVHWDLVLSVQQQPDLPKEVSHREEIESFDVKEETLGEEVLVMDGFDALIERVQLTLFDRQQKVVEGREFIFGDDRQRRRVAELHFGNAQMNEDRALVPLHETRTTLKRSNQNSPWLFDSRL